MGQYIETISDILIGDADIIGIVSATFLLSVLSYRIDEK